MALPIPIYPDQSDKSVLLKEAKLPKLSDRLSEELVIALVGPVGSGCSTTATELKKSLELDFSYEVHYHKLSDIIKEQSHLITSFKEKKGISGHDQVQDLQTNGDLLRRSLGKDYLAAKAIEKIALNRMTSGFGESSEGNPIPKSIRRAHIIDSLKHPDELKLLRATYGEIFWLIGVFAPRSIREERLQIYQRISREKIDHIISRDYREDDDCGQQVRDLFFQADLFVRNDQPNTRPLSASLNRFLEVLFGIGVHTPTKDETAMYAAYAEAAKSACLSRQVGAAIVDKEGELLSVGRNDVPKFKGGLYCEDDLDQDHRCHNWQSKECHNDRKKNLLYSQVFNKLQENGLLVSSTKEEDVIKALKKTDAKALIEYSRAVHAEMDAITTAARLGKPGVLGGTLFSTTYPCHSCARHIVAAGLSRVIFIEPYPKSLAGELHSDSVSENESDLGKKTVFLQYSGIAPKNIIKLFIAGKSRKTSSGSLSILQKKIASPVVGVSLDDYSTHEKLVIAELTENESKASIGNQATLFES